MAITLLYRLFTQTGKLKYIASMLALTLALCAGKIQAQDITISSLTTGVAASPLQGGTADQAILGFKLSKAGGGTNSVTAITVSLSQNPSGKITNARLYVSANDNFDGIGSETLITAGTLGASSISFTGTPITGFGNDPGPATRSYFVVVDVDPNVTSAATLQPSLTSGNITINNDNKSGTAPGTDYSFTELSTAIGSLNAGANNVAASPLVPNATGQAVLGFSLDSNGSQTVSQLNVQLSSDPSGKLSSWSLVRSTDADFASGGDNTTIAGLTFTPSASQVVITGLSEDVSSLKNYFLVATVGANPSGTIQASLGSGNITVNQGYASSSATGTDYSFLTVEITSLNGGANNVAASPLIAGSTGKAVFGFSLVSGGAQNVTQLNIQLTSTPISKLTNWSLVRSADTDFATANTTIAGLTFTPSATEVEITGLAEDVSSVQNYFLVADVEASVTSGTAAIQASLGSSNVTVDVGGVTGSAAGTNYSFDAITTAIGSLNAGANNVAASPLVAGSTGKAVFGFSLASNASQTVSQLNIQLTSDPSSKLTNWSLVRSADADFATANTTIAGLTFTASATEVQITGLSEDVSTLKNYFLVADVHPSVTGATTSVGASLGAGNVTFSPAVGIASGTSTGTVYSFAALTTTIGSLNAGANNVATSPIVAGSTGKAVFGFSLSSNGSQTVSQLNIQLTSDPTSKLTNWSLVRSADTDFATANTIIGGLTFTPSATELIITGLSEDVSTAKNYFLVADVDGSVTALTPTIRASLGSGNVTFNPVVGSASGSSTGTVYSFAALTTTIGSLNAGANNVALSPLVATTTGKAVFGFSLTSNGSQTVSQLNIQLTSNPASKLSNWSLVRSADTDFATANTTIGGLTFTPSATELVITGLSEDVSTAKNYFLVADVDAAVTGLTPTISASLGSGNVTFNPVIGSASGSSTGTVYSFAALTATLTEITAGTAPVISATQLIAGQTDRVLTGFSITSNGSQVLSSINFNISGLTAGQLTNIRLFRSTTVGVSGSSILTDANSDGNFDDLSTVAGGDKTVTTTPTYYYLVADVLNTVTNNTVTYPNVTVAPTQANVVFATGGKNSLSISRTFSFIQSNSSDIILSAGNTANITITTNNTAANPGDPLDASDLTKSALLANFTLRDGGNADDSDDLPTVLDGLTITVENPANLDRIALFDNTGTKIPGTDKDPSSGTVNWTSLNYATSDDRSAGAAGLRSFSVRATYKTIVTDNQQTDVDIVATTSAAETGSYFAATNAGGAGTTGSANHNQTEVVATKLVFVNPNDLPITNTVDPYFGSIFAIQEDAILTQDNFDLTVAAVDANNNLDFDEVSTVLLNTTPSASVVLKDDGAAIAALALSGGIRTFTNLTIDDANTYIVGATDQSVGGTLTAAAGPTGVEVVIQSPGVNITTAADAMCKTAASANTYIPLDNIVLEEANAGDFGTGSNLSFLLILPSGWEFNTTVGGTVSVTAVSPSSNPSNITLSQTSCDFLGNTIAKFVYSVTNTNKFDRLTISGLQIKNTGGLPTPGAITRGGTGVINGCCDDVKNLGTLTTTSSTIVDFGVQEYPGQPVIPSTQIKFPKISEPIILNGEVPPGTPDGTIGSFSGTSVTKINVPELSGDRYTFNPNILTAGLYDVTFSYSDVSGCISELTKEFEVFEGAINGLAASYCADDISPKNIKVNNTFRPADATVVLDPDTAFSIRIPTYKYIREVTNNAGTLTLTIKNHGFNDGDKYWIYIANSTVQFTGPDAPYGYIYKECTISNTTTDQFDIDANVVGNWDQYYGIVYLPSNYYYYFDDVTYSGSTVTITAPNHGLVDDARPYLYTYFWNGVDYFYVEGFYTIDNSTPNTFTISVTVPLGYTWLGYGYVQTNWYRVTSFIPSLTELNTNLVNETSIDVGYFIKYNWCTYTGCDIYYTIHETPVQIYKLPIVSFTGLKGLDDPYCLDDAPIEVVGSKANPSGEGTFSVTSGNGTIANIVGTGKATFTPSAQTPNVNIDITYSYTDVNGCTGTSTNTTLVKSLLSAPIANDTTYCQNVNAPEEVKLKARGELNAFYRWYTVSDPEGVAISDQVYSTGIKTNINNPLQYFVTQTTATSCESPPAQVDVTINTQPAATFTTNPTTLCDGKDFTVTATMSATPNPTKFTWDFNGELIVPVDNNNSYVYNFTGTGNRNITLSVVDANNCTNSATDQVGLNSNPKPDFTHDFICENDNTRFTGSVEGNPGNITGYSWEFLQSDLTPIGSLPQAPPNIVNYQFTNGAGEYLVTVTAYNNLGCFDSNTKQITILENQTATSASPYDMASVDNGQGFWRVLENSVNPTWEYGTIAGKADMANTFGTTPVWATSLTSDYLPNESSSLNSPCFDFSGVQRPIISLDFFLETDRSRDGVVLEFSKDNGLNWAPVGLPNSGLNWFNTQAFQTGLIGNSPVGWSDSSTNLSDNTDRTQFLVQGRRALDNLGLTLAERQKLRFRLSFKSDGTAENLEGFAVSNIRIEPRNRVLLVENFTNMNDPEYTAVKTIYDAIDPLESVKLQYHVSSIGGSDANSIINPAEQTARSGFYGITLTDGVIPRSYIDGLSFGPLDSNPTGATVNWFNKRSLVASPVELAVESESSTEANYLKAKVTITALVDIPNLQQLNPKVHMAMVEQLDANSNEFVFRKFISSPLGLTIPPANATQLMTTGQVLTLEDSILIEGNMMPNDLSLVAFIQDENSKLVFQSAIELNPDPLTLPTPITGVEDPTYANKINLFPNPANEELHIVLPEAVRNTTPVVMFDSYGKKVFENAFSVGQKRKTVQTSEMAAGVYIIQIATPDGSMARKKVMVVH